MIDRRVQFTMRRLKWAALAAAALLFLSGCSAVEKTGGDLTMWAAGKLNEGLTVVGGGVQEVLDDLHNADYQGGPFENDLDSARAYLLGQMQEKYGMEFAVVGDEDLVNYGLFAGATYTCDVAPVDAPEQVTTALVSQSMYRDVRDSYAVYFFKEEAEAPVLAFCESKDYILDQRVSLEMPGTAYTWTAEDGLKRFLAGSGAYVEMVLRFEDGLDAGTYAEQVLDLLNSIGQLSCNLSIQVKANGTYIFFSEPKILDGFDPSSYTVEELEQRIEEDLSIGGPR